MSNSVGSGGPTVRSPLLARVTQSTEEQRRNADAQARGEVLRKLTSVVRWTARVTALAIAAVFLMFVLGEPKGPLPGIHSREGAGMMLLFGAIVAMVLAWKWEFSAALISLIALGAFAAVVHINRYAVLFILAIPSVLFLLDWTLRRRSAPARSYGLQQNSSGFLRLQR